MFAKETAELKKDLEDLGRVLFGSGHHDSHLRRQALAALESAETCIRRAREGILDDAPPPHATPLSDGEIGRVRSRIRSYHPPENLHLFTGIESFHPVVRGDSRMRMSLNKVSSVFDGINGDNGEVEVRRVFMRASELEHVLGVSITSRTIGTIFVNRDVLERLPQNKDGWVDVFGMFTSNCRARGSDVLTLTYDGSEFADGDTVASPHPPFYESIPGDSAFRARFMPHPSFTHDAVSGVNITEVSKRYPTPDVRLEVANTTSETETETETGEDGVDDLSIDEDLVMDILPGTRGFIVIGNVPSHDLEFEPCKSSEDGIIPVREDDVIRGGFSTDDAYIILLPRETAEWKIHGSPALRRRVPPGATDLVDDTFQTIYRLRSD
jgi:hypothetical protein